MNERVKIFMESASQMGVGKPELEALTKLFKVCLESALMLDDEQNIEYDTDTTGFDFSEDDYDSEDNDERPSKYDSEYDDIDDLDTRLPGERRDSLKTDKSIWRDDDIGLNASPEQRDNIKYESNVGTSLANAYINFAPKLLDRNICSAKDADNMANFIDWLIKAYNKFDPREYMAKIADQFDRKKSYDTDRLDKIVNVASLGPHVVQLLTEIKNTFSDELATAAFTNEASVFPVAKDINTFISDKFNTDSDDLDAEQADQSIVFDDSGFRDVDAEEEKANPNKEKALTDEEVRQMNNAAKKTSPKPLYEDESLDSDTVENAVIDFVNVVPTIGLSDKELAEFNKPVKKETKKKLKTAAAKRGEVSKMYNGDVVDAKAWKKSDEDDLWADL